MSEQLTLGISLRDDATFANFVPGANADLLKVLLAFVQEAGERFVYVFGNHGVGSSHLLQASCHAVSAQDHPVVYLPLAQSELQPGMLEGMEHMGLVAIDDIDCVLGQPAWEEALFHFYNRAQQAQTKLIVSAHQPPGQLQCQLADLQSRLCWGLSLKVTGLTDAEKLQALQLRASQRGLTLTEEVGQYLMHRYPRDMGVLFTVLNTLDHASLVAKRRLTIPFVKETLDLA